MPDFIARVDYIGNGTRTDFTFSFPVIDPTFVKVTIDGGIPTFTQPSAGTVRITPAPADGSKVSIRRQSGTPGVPLVSYANGVAISGDALDLGYTHSLHRADESIDAALDLVDAAVDAAEGASTVATRSVPIVTPTDLNAVLVAGAAGTYAWSPTFRYNAATETLSVKTVDADFGDITQLTVTTLVAAGASGIRFRTSAATRLTLTGTLATFTVPVELPGAPAPGSNQAVRQVDLDTAYTSSILVADANSKAYTNLFVPSVKVIPIVAASFGGRLEIQSAVSELTAVGIPDSCSFVSITSFAVGQLETVGGTTAEFSVRAFTGAGVLIATLPLGEFPCNSINSQTFSGGAPAVFTFTPDLTGIVLRFYVRQPAAIGPFVLFGFRASGFAVLR